MNATRVNGTPLEVVDTTYGDVRPRDIIIDDRWPDMFGRRVIEVEHSRTGLVGLSLVPSAGLAARADVPIRVLR